MRKIEALPTEQDVKQRLDELKAEGVAEDDITLVSNRDLQAGGAFSAYSGVNIKHSTGSTWDKVMSFFTGDDPEDQTLNSMNLSSEEEREYRNALDADKILLHVSDEGSRNDTAQSDMNRNDAAYGSGTIGAAGAGHTPGVDREDDNLGDKPGAGFDADRKDRNHDDEATMELREERLNVEKDNVQTGEVNVDKHVETERQEFEVPVEREEVTVERRKVDDERPADGDFTDSDESIRVPVNEERVNVDKESVVSEEVVIKKDKVKDTEHVSEDVRHEDVDIQEDTEDRGLDKDRGFDKDLDRDRADGRQSDFDYDDNKGRNDRI